MVESSFGNVKEFTAQLFSDSKSCYSDCSVADKKFVLGESPFYDERTGNLSFVDIMSHAFYIIDKNGKCSSYDVGQMVGAAVPAEKAGTYMLAMTDGLYLFDGKDVNCIFDLSNIYEPYRRSNDAKCDPAGRLFFGSSTWNNEYEPGGNLYCYDDGTVRILQKNTKISNGMAWTKNKKKFLFSDSLEHCVFVYDYDISTGNISGRRELFHVDDGVPDGMCIDGDDNVWLAVWGGRRIECHSSVDGSLLARVNVPAEQVSSCCFYGTEKDSLFITSAGEGLSGKYDGRLFSCKVF
ncbi:MAG: SMP-30/gluconolactonase/LRE family protein [Treponema sp.]|nr:SMP-30/gluconolactonase/LRE family protein [Treponema sp.]